LFLGVFQGVTQRLVLGLGLGQVVGHGQRGQQHQARFAHLANGLRDLQHALVQRLAQRLDLVSSPSSQPTW